MINMKKKKLKKKVILVIVLFILTIAGAFSFFVYSKHQEEVRIHIQKLKEEKLLKSINDSYGKVVSVTKDTKIYRLDKDNYIEVGTISKGQIINLEENQKIDLNTKYFKILNSELYISYKDIKPTEETVAVDDQRYKKYLLFDENIVTKENAKLYNKDKTTLEYTIKDKIDTPVIIKDAEGVFIEYFNKLMFVKLEDIENTYPKANNTLEETTAVPVTCYHFIYLPGDNTCDEIICHPQSQIESHFTYLTENNYFSINTTELRLFIEGNLRLPKNTILITIDDGARAEKFIPLLEKYKLNATLFLVSSWYPKETFASPYMEIASHTHNLHTGNKCPGGQGGWIKCLEHDALLADFVTSRQTLDNTEAFCYPFYEYNNYTISVLKEAGFKMGFAGGQKKTTRGVDLFNIPRITLHRSTTLQEYINFVS